MARDEETRRSLINLIKSTSGINWDEEARFGGRIGVFNGLLLIRQTPRAHAQIEEMLNQVH